MLLVFALVASLAAFVYNLPFLHLQELNSPPVNNEHCKLIKQGAIEDMVFDENNLLMYFGEGAGKHRRVWYPPVGLFGQSDNDEIYRDKLYSYDVSGAGHQPKELKITNYDGQDFVSHGMSLLPVEGENRNLLYVVNHQRSGSVISIFSHVLDEDHVTHVFDVKSDILKTPNAVVGVTPNEIYATNDRYFKSAKYAKFNIIVNLFRTLNAVHCKFDIEANTTQCTNLYPRKLYYGNGIEILPKRREVVVADSMEGAFYRYPLAADNSVIAKDSVHHFIGKAIDNVRRVPGTSDFVVTIFPNFKEVMSHMIKHRGDVSAAALLFKESNNYTEPEVLYHDSRQDIKFLTIFGYVPQTKKLYSGSVAYEGLLECDVN